VAANIPRLDLTNHSRGSILPTNPGLLWLQVPASGIGKGPAALLRPVGVFGATKAQSVVLAAALGVPALHPAPNAASLPASATADREMSLAEAAQRNDESGGSSAAGSAAATPQVLPAAPTATAPAAPQMTVHMGNVRSGQQVSAHAQGKGGRVLSFSHCWRFAPARGLLLRAHGVQSAGFPWNRCQCMAFFASLSRVCMRVCCWRLTGARSGRAVATGGGVG